MFARYFDLKDVWRYDPETGYFYWKIRARKYGPFPGDRAGALVKGYIQLTYGGKKLRANRVAWFFMTGSWPPPDLQVEHRDGDRVNNSWKNLYLVIRQKNSQNLRDKLSKANKSGYRGVSRVNGTWRAHIGVNGRLIVLGHFKNLLDAAAARKKGEEYYFPYDRHRD
jgi:HNH endonuclease